MWLDGSKSRDARREIPIIGYIGANGSGKSLLAVNDCLASLDAGRPVLSSARLVDPDSDEQCPLTDEECGFALHPNHKAPHPLWIPLTNFQQIVDAEHCDILLDEITGIASSRESRGLPAAVGDRLMQCRRVDVVVRWTAPAWGRSDVMLREVTQAAVLARGSFRRRVEGNRSWKASTLIGSRLVDARDLDELTQAQRLGTARAKLDVLNRGLQLVSRTRARDAYATMDSVTSLIQSVGGPCLACGGVQQRHKCECHGPARKGGSPAPVAAPQRALQPRGRLDSIVLSA